MVNLSELTPLAKELNQTTDEINSIISTVNEKLAALNLGVEAWLDPSTTSKIPAADLTVTTHLHRSTASMPVLGYAKLEDAWQLAIKEEKIIYQWNDDAREEEEVSEDSYRPLLKASRDVRLRALEQLPQLLDALKRQGEAVLKTIARAQKAAEAL